MSVAKEIGVDWACYLADEYGAGYLVQQIKSGEPLPGQKTAFAEVDARAGATTARNAKAARKECRKACDRHLINVKLRGVAGFALR